MKKKREKKENSERWLLTYSDLITLLMIFFVTMYAMSNTDAAKYKAISESFSVALGGGKDVMKVTNGVGTTTAIVEPTSAPDPTGDNGQDQEDLLNAAKVQLDKYFKENGLNPTVTTEINERGLVVSLYDAALFGSGDADIKTDSKATVIEIGKIVNKIGDYIRVEGHTDNVPISTYKFKSNWELSVMRATTVTELLINSASIPPAKISACGYGEFRPVGDNSTEAGRSKNRRVNIVILNSKYNGSEVPKQ